MPCGFFRDLRSVTKRKLEAKDSVIGDKTYEERILA